MRSITCQGEFRHAADGEPVRIFPILRPRQHAKDSLHRPFDAVLSVLFAEEKGHRLPTDRFGTVRPRTVGEAGFFGVIACCSLQISPSSSNRPIISAGT